jgi:hypothetical protein
MRQRVQVEGQAWHVPLPKLVPLIVAGKHTHVRTHQTSSVLGAYVKRYVYLYIERRRMLLFPESGPQKNSRLTGFH